MPSKSEPVQRTVGALRGRPSEGKMPPINRETELLGAIFRMHREMRGLTLKDMSRSIGLCINSIRRHEAGHLMLRINDLLTAARIMEIDPARLLIRNGYIHGPIKL